MTAVNIRFEIASFKSKIFIAIFCVMIYIIKLAEMTEDSQSYYLNSEEAKSNT